MNVSILFRPKNRVRAKIFRTFRESFSNFSPSRKFFRRPKNFFQNLADSAAIRLVQKSSKSEPSSSFFGCLKFRGNFVPCELLQNFLCGYKIEMATWFCIAQPTRWEKSVIPIEDDDGLIRLRKEIMAHLMLQRRLRRTAVRHSTF